MFQKTPTMQDIVKANPVFFSNETLRFFNQKFSDFKVMLTPDRERCFTYAKNDFKSSTGQVFPGVTVAEYTGDELLNQCQIDDFPNDIKTVYEVETWIELL